MFSAMNSSHSHARMLVGACTAMTLLLAGCGRGDQQRAAPPLPVTVMQVQSKTAPFVLETAGRAEGSKEIEVRARVSGILQQRVYAEGAAVKAGGVLFRIERAPFEIAVQRARAALAAEQARNQQAHRTMERVQELMARNLVSRNEFDAATSVLQASDAAILAAQANVREAELNYSYTTVTAPIGGVTGRALRSEGALLTAGTESGLLTTVTQVDPIWARFALSVTESDALRTALAAGKEKIVAAELIRADGAAHPQKGVVNFSASTVDPTLGTVQLRAEFSNPGMRVLPGEYVRIRIVGGARTIVPVPQLAVQQGPKGAYVWIVNAQDQAEQRPVSAGEWSGDEWRIESGLQDGDRIIIDNLLKLRPGQAVAAQPAPGAERDATKPAAKPPNDARS